MAFRIGKTGQAQVPEFFLGTAQVKFPECRIMDQVSGAPNMSLSEKSEIPAFVEKL